MRFASTALVVTTLVASAALGSVRASEDGGGHRPTLAELAAPVVAAEEAAAAAAAATRTATLDAYGEQDDQEAFFDPDGRGKGTDIAHEIRREHANRRASHAPHHPLVKAPPPPPPPTTTSGSVQAPSAATAGARPQPQQQPSMAPACTSDRPPPKGPIAYTVSQLAGVNCARAAAGIDDAAAAAVGTVADRPQGRRPPSGPPSNLPGPIDDGAGDFVAPTTQAAADGDGGGLAAPASAGPEPSTANPLHLGGGGSRSSAAGEPASSTVRSPPSNPITDLLNALGNANVGGGGGGEGAGAAAAHNPIADAAQALSTSPLGQAATAVDNLAKGIQAAVNQNPLQLAAGAIAQVAKWNHAAVPAAGAVAAAGSGPGVFAVTRPDAPGGAPAVRPLSGSAVRPAVADLGRRIGVAMAVKPGASLAEAFAPAPTAGR